MTHNITFVTGLWDIGRDQLDSGFERNFDEYVGFLQQFINETDIPIILYTSRDIAHKLPEVEKVHIVEKSIEDLRQDFSFTNEIEEIRTSFNWYNEASWLRSSPQAALRDYNLITLSKYFLLNDATYYDPFKSKYFYWIDAGIARTLPLHYTKTRVMDKIINNFDVDYKLLMLSYPYTGNTEIHGFKRPAMNKYAGVEFIDYVCRGGFFGGSKYAINVNNHDYWDMLRTTILDGYMGTEESVFTILSYTRKDRIERFDIGDSGLIYHFFEHIRDTKKTINKQSLYVLSFNSPDQFEHLIQSFKFGCVDFITKPDKFLINNSTDRSTDEKYAKLCKKYGFEEIKFDNIGINRGRQFVADHFEESSNEYYIFFEDDMNLNSASVSESSNKGFITYIDDLYNKTLSIMKLENLDFLKLTFPEFYGDNSTQWAWYNIPQHIRARDFPSHNQLPQNGFSPNPPHTKIECIKIHRDVPYAIGDVYYCNWPIWFSREGNQKVFIETRFDHPYEQTWMSHVYNLHKENKLKSGVLLASPITHDRFDHYKGERREN